MIARITDRLVLNPSRNPLPIEDKTVHTLPYGRHQLEVMKMRVGISRPELMILKFGGNGSRAEKSEVHPGEVWPNLNAEVWAVNYPGFGNSTGRAGLRAMVRTAELAYQHIAQEAAGRPILVTGNSIGTTCALYLAARRPIAGILLRNPPPLRQLIFGEYGWWNMWLGSSLVAMGVPDELNSIANARRATVPAVFLMSGRDHVVPPKYQALIHDAYGGPNKIVVDAEADHSTPLAREVEPDYIAALQWLKRQAGLDQGCSANFRSSLIKLPSNRQKAYSREPSTLALCKAAVACDRLVLNR